MNTKSFSAAGILGLAASLNAQAAGTLFSGSIQYDSTASPNPITTTGTTWSNPNTKLTWSISYVGGSFPWQYTYNWETSGQELSHIIFEASANTVFADFSNLDGGTVSFGNQDAGGGANPSMPEDVKGIKFDTVGNPQDLTLTFASTRPPTWGDFYAKTGQGEAWNTGFTVLDTDPIVDFVAIAVGDLSSLQHDGPSRAIHIAVPDTLLKTPPDFQPVPEPGTVAAGLGLGMLALGTLIRRKR